MNFYSQTLGGSLTGFRAQQGEAVQPNPRACPKQQHTAGGMSVAKVVLSAGANENVSGDRKGNIGTHIGSCALAFIHLEYFYGPFNHFAKFIEAFSSFAFNCECGGRGEEKEKQEETVRRPIHRLR